MAHIFISYNPTDLIPLGMIVGFLRQEYKDKTIWYDDVSDAANWSWANIQGEIQNCDLFIYLCSNESLNSRSRHSELRYALQLGKHLLAVIIPPTTTDFASIPGDLKPALQKTPQITISQYDKNAKELSEEDIKKFRAEIKTKNIFSSSSGNHDEEKPPELGGCWKISEGQAIVIAAIIGFIGVVLTILATQGDGTPIPPTPTPTISPIPTTPAPPTPTALPMGVLFMEDFEDGVSHDFALEGFSIRDMGGNQAYCGTAPEDGIGDFVGDSGRNYSIEAQMMFLKKNDNSWIEVRGRADGGWTKGYALFAHASVMSFSRMSSDGDVFFDGLTKSVVENIWYVLRLDLNESTISAFIDGQQIGQNRADTAHTEGLPGIGAGNGEVCFGNIVVRTHDGMLTAIPLTPTPIITLPPSPEATPSPVTPPSPIPPTTVMPPTQDGTATANASMTHAVETQTEIKKQTAFAQTRTQIAINLTASYTKTPIEIALDYARAGVSSNAEWKNLYPNGFVVEFEDAPMALVPAGCFRMGNDADEADGGVICFSNPFWIDIYEVRQGDFARLNGVKTNPSDFPHKDRPVVNINWQEAGDFCSSRAAYLPTEAEWEYAARGPDALVFPWGNEWNSDNAVFDVQITRVVGSFPTGISWIGAFDLSGNAAEWTNSVYMLYPYNNSDGREDTNSTAERVFRGGSWYNTVENILRSANRLRAPSDYQSNLLGFRCVRRIF